MDLGMRAFKGHAQLGVCQWDILTLKWQGRLLSGDRPCGIQSPVIPLFSPPQQADTLTGRCVSQCQDLVVLYCAKASYSCLWPFYSQTLCLCLLEGCCKGVPCLCCPLPSPRCLDSKSLHLSEPPQTEVEELWQRFSISFAICEG